MIQISSPTTRKVGGASNPPVGAERRLIIQYAVASALAEFDTLEECAKAILRSVADQDGWEFGALWLVDRDQHVIRCVEVYCSSDALVEFAESTRSLRFQKGGGLPGRVWQTQRAEWLDDLPADGTFARLSTALKAGIKSGFAFPVLFGEEALGAFEFFSNERRSANAELLESLRAVGLQMGQFVKRKEAFGHAAQLAAIVESS